MPKSKTTVVFRGWKQGMQKVPLTKLVREMTENGLADSKRVTDGLLEGHEIRIEMSSEVTAPELLRRARELGVVADIETMD